MALLGLSECALADRAINQRTGMSLNRGTLSQVLRGFRPCASEDRTALLQAVKAAPDSYERFLCVSQLRSSEPEFILPTADLHRFRAFSEERGDPAFDPPSCPHPLLRRGQSFLARGFYPKALLEFTQTYRDAAANHF